MHLRKKENRFNELKYANVQIPPENFEGIEPELCYDIRSSFPENLMLKQRRNEDSDESDNSKFLVNSWGGAADLIQVPVPPL
ncbi:hypothetical protein GcM1_227049 [Golovinomyces cichoracearum]|uniref:Uncharacterized protein n=1 Tax=Golovinomyces cichoracearum TaxID=62708 RepID=A0A420IPH8_9PEZI|nr:hypothetical protein GcM1_227049 [Golovinomyces cichoracearum]